MTNPASTASLSRAAFATLLLIAFMMGANHVAARLAFDNGVSVATAVAFRSTVTALVTDRKIYPPQAALHRTIWPFCRSLVPV